MNMRELTEMFLKAYKRRLLNVVVITLAFLGGFFVSVKPNAQLENFRDDALVSSKNEDPTRVLHRVLKKLEISLKFGGRFLGAKKAIKAAQSVLDALQKVFQSSLKEDIVCTKFRLLCAKIKRDVIKGDTVIRKHHLYVMKHLFEKFDEWLINFSFERRGVGSVRDNKVLLLLNSLNKILLNNLLDEDLVEFHSAKDPFRLYYQKILHNPKTSIAVAAAAAAFAFVIAYKRNKKNEEERERARQRQEKDRKITQAYEPIKKSFSETTAAFKALAEECVKQGFLLGDYTKFENHFSRSKSKKDKLLGSADVGESADELFVDEKGEVDVAKSLFEQTLDRYKKLCVLKNICDEIINISGIPQAFLPTNFATVPVGSDSLDLFRRLDFIQGTPNALNSEKGAVEQLLNIISAYAGMLDEAGFDELKKRLSEKHNIKKISESDKAALKKVLTADADLGMFLGSGEAIKNRLKEDKLFKQLFLENDNNLKMFLKENNDPKKILENESLVCHFVNLVKDHEIRKRDAYKKALYKEVGIKFDVELQSNDTYLRIIMPDVCGDGHSVSADGLIKIGGTRKEFDKIKVYMNALQEALKLPELKDFSRVVEKEKPGLLDSWLKKRKNMHVLKNQILKWLLTAKELLEENGSLSLFENCIKDTCGDSEVPLLNTQLEHIKSIEMWHDTFVNYVRLDRNNEVLPVLKKAVAVEMFKEDWRLLDISEAAPIIVMWKGALNKYVEKLGAQCAKAARILYRSGCIPGSSLKSVKNTFLERPSSSPCEKKNQGLVLIKDALQANESTTLKKLYEVVGNEGGVISLIKHEAGFVNRICNAQKIINALARMNSSIRPLLRQEENLYLTDWAKCFNLSYVAKTLERCMKRLAKHLIANQKVKPTSLAAEIRKSFSELSEEEQNKIIDPLLV